MTLDNWLTRHPYLQPIAEFRAQVEAAMEDLPIATSCSTEWCAYRSDFQAGVPLLRSSSFVIDRGLIQRALRSLIRRLLLMRLPGSLERPLRELGSELDENSIPAGIWIGENARMTVHGGLLRYLGWSATTKHLSTVVGAFTGWRNEEIWLRSYCPTCGSAPAMAQLAGTDCSRMRLLCCGCCGTRWRYRRAACPFCENENDRQLAIMSIEGEEGLRIDYCKCCDGYLKTYEGQGNETVLLSDWTSIHLDVIAHDCGLKRLAASLYEL